MKYIDLHLHSNCSDGTMTPEELVEEAHRLGISAISITDHDTIEGTAEAMEAGKKRGVEVVSGVEISAYLDDTPLHMLGYGFRHSDLALHEKLKQVQLAREERNSKILYNLGQLGINITPAELKKQSGTGQTGRPHIAAILMEKKIVRTMDEAFARYLRRGAAAYAERTRLMATDAIDMISAAGGIAVLAHPLTLDRTMLTLATVLERLHKLGIAGVEAYYPIYSVGERGKIIGLCRELGLLITGGSDFHGSMRNGTRLGGNNKKQRVPYELFEKLKQQLDNTSVSDQKK
ncbi:MAG: PHP domain-containing protein [Pseudomonadota bacterium]